MTSSLEYVLPLKWADDDGLVELSRYLGEVVRHARVTVVDGSTPVARARHEAAFPQEVNVIAADPELALNGKVAGVLTAIPTLRGEKVVIADDDVRYTGTTLARMSVALEDFDVVRPQNHFVTADQASLPWHARWDTARSLLNRVFGSDYPGTLGVRLEYLAGGYDGNLLFENLELIRTVPAVRGRALQIQLDAQQEIARRLAEAFPDRLDPVRAAALTGAFIGAIAGALQVLLADPDRPAGPAGLHAAVRTATDTALAPWLRPDA